MRERTGPSVEEFHFMRWGFDITALRAMLERTPLPEEIRISVSAAARLLKSDPAATPEGERSVPVVDGWHRIALARRLSVDELPALLFTRTQITGALLPRSSPLPPEAPTH